jgi:hypothetical protein
MNILPFVITMLMIFSISTAMHMRSSLGLSSTTASAEGLHRSSIRAESMACRRQYLKLKVKEQKKASKRQKSSINTAYHWHRHTHNPTAAAKLNIAPLLQEGIEKKQPLIDIAAKLIYELYKDKYFTTSLNDPRWHYTILDLVTKELKKQKEGLPSFALVSPADGPYKMAIYKILKGSGSFDIPSYRGIIPLEEIFTIDDPKAPIIHFTYAQACILRAAFGDDIVQKIQILEKDKSLKKQTPCTLSKEELFPLLEETMGFEKATKCSAMLSFSTRFASLDKIVADDTASSIRSVRAL